MSCFTRVFSYIKHTKRATAIGLAALSLSATALADGASATVPKSEYDSYIVIMAQDPAIAYEGGIKGYQATKPDKRSRLVVIVDFVLLARAAVFSLNL